MLEYEVKMFQGDLYNKLYDFYLIINMRIKILLHAHDKRLFVLSQQNKIKKNKIKNKIKLYHEFFFVFIPLYAV